MPGKDYVSSIRDFWRVCSGCDEVAQALEEGAFDKVSAGAHKLKSSARSIGAAAVADICEEIEIATSKGEMAAIEELAPRLNTEVQAVIGYIDRL